LELGADASSAPLLLGPGFGGRDETFPPKFSASGCGRCRVAGRTTVREGASISDAAGDLDRLRTRRRDARHHCPLIGQSLSQRFGQSVVIDNRPGASGNLALQAVARAPADGYTLLMVATPHAINVTLYEKSVCGY
jgi:hypothetical protein